MEPGGASSLLRFAFALILIATNARSPANARVSAFELLSRTDVLGGQAFGATGAYEKIVGTLHFADDPNAPANRRIVDLGKAPRNARGEVESSANVMILQPKDPARANGAAIVEISNRGGKGLLYHANQTAPSMDPTTQADFGDGFLMKHGFTVVWVGWQFDVPAKPNAMRLTAPVATEHGRTITGLVRADFHVDASAPEAPLGHNGQTPYAVADEHDPADVLTERDEILAPRRVLPRAAWHFGASATTVALDGGFAPGKIYELVYRARDPVVTGLGLAAQRDAVAWLKHDPAAPAHVARAYGYGISQTGRFLRQFFYEGFNLDEEGRNVFDGAMPIVSGAALGSFNYRFAQPSRDAAAFSSFLYPTDRFPFTDAVEADPLTGARDGVLAHAPLDPSQAKIVYLFTSHEYYGRVASLMTTSVDGKRDVELPANVRAYAYMGGQHVPRVPVRRNPHDRYPTDPLDYTWSERALLLRLDAWVKDGTPPPQSRYPRIADSTLVAPEAVRFPRIAGVATPSPEVVHRAYRLDFGPSWPQGIESLQPPAVGTAYPVLVPQVDADGNDIGGLRLPEVAVPLGTYTGWNLRVPSDGFGSHLVDFYGS